MKHRNKIAVMMTVMAGLFVAILSHLPAVKADAYGTATYTVVGNGLPSTVITPVVGSVVTVVLSGDDFTLVHLNIQNDGATASVGTDYVVVMNNQDLAGAAVTMAANYNDGVKMIVGAGAAATFNASTIPAGADGTHEIQLQAVGHGAKMQLIKGHFTP